MIIWIYFLCDWKLSLKGRNFNFIHCCRHALYYSVIFGWALKGLLNFSWYQKMCCSLFLWLNLLVCHFQVFHDKCSKSRWSFLITMCFYSMSTSNENIFQLHVDHKALNQNGLIPAVRLNLFIYEALNVPLNCHYCRTTLILFLCVIPTPTLWLWFIWIWWCWDLCI